MTGSSRSERATPPIQLRGIRVHNLKNVDVDIPRGKLVAICGVSGSGKTSLALDTLYAEGQRRYIESFSAYTRQFLQRLDKPDYDSIDHLPPALAVTRQGASRSNRSTIGSASETLDYLRLLYAKIARLVCISCGRSIVSHSADSVARRVHAWPDSLRLLIAFAVRWDDIADRAAVLAELQGTGFVRLAAGGRMLHLGQTTRDELATSLPSNGTCWVLVDRISGGSDASRVTESLETAFHWGDGKIGLLADISQGEVPVELSDLIAPAQATEFIDSIPYRAILLNSQLSCSHCDIDYPTPEPRLFNFNSPLGACPQCEGFGDTLDLDLKSIVPDPTKSIRQGAIAPWNSPAYSHNLDELLDIARDLDFPVDVPFEHLSDSQVRLLIDGCTRPSYGGLKGFFALLERKKYKMHVRVFLSRWRTYTRCTQCQGQRLKSHALGFKIGGKSLAEICVLEIDAAADFLATLQLDDRQQSIAEDLLREVTARLGYLQSVGLGYLALDRTLRTLSGGEAQRTALTASLGSSLVNMLYVLDEPSVGLHPHDCQQLGAAIERLQRRGNTVVMVEHEQALLEKADWLVEIGPQAGEGGGRVVFSGTMPELLVSDQSLTGAYLSGRRRIPLPAKRRITQRGWIRLLGCHGNNLRNIDVEFPLGVLCLVTGVSGSGKSSLVQDTLFGALASRLRKKLVPALAFQDVIGDGQIDDCILVDQSPISRSPRSNPVTYVKAFDELRNVFADTLDAKSHNYTAGHFSFNSDLGRCPECHGDGVLVIDMQFLADVTMKCPSCNGDRYRKEILEVRYRDRNMAEVLRMTVRAALHFFRGAERVQQKLKPLVDVGLEYLQLGQSAMTLSAGEAQRLKLAAYLASASRNRTLFLLDEPTTGLHTHDMLQLIDCFDALLAAGHSLIVVEHNLHLMACADYIIDLGPGPAQRGGRVVATGTPEEIACCAESITGRFLARELV